MTATKVRNMRMTDEEWGGLQSKALAAGYRDRTAYLVAIAVGIEPKPVEVFVERVVEVPLEVRVEVPVIVEKPRLPFEEAWEKLGKPKQDRLTAYPGSKAAAKALYEME